MSHRLTDAELLRRFREVHGEGTYTYPTPLGYTGRTVPIKIICPVHGEFWQQPANHLQGRGCISCSITKSAERCKNKAKAKRPDLSHIETPEGSKAVPVGTKGNYALVDDEDYERVMEHNWYLTASGYAYNKNLGYMHRFIMGEDNDHPLDHKDLNKLNNQRSNLRFCTHGANNSNVPPVNGRYKGVYKLSGSKKILCTDNI